MKLNRRELRKILHDFNSISNRLLQANFEDYNGILAKFLRYINTTDVIFDYVRDCGECTWDLQSEFAEIIGSYGRMIFALGATDEEEVRNVYSILEHIVAHNIEVYYGLTSGYSPSGKFQDRIKAFNERVVMVLIRHIECYLTKIGIDMGVDETIMYNITVHNGQVNVANDTAVINATNNLNTDSANLAALMQAVRDTAINLPAEDMETVSDSLETIETEVVSATPKKGLLRIALNALQAMKGTVEFGAAVAALVEFVGPLVGLPLPG